MTPKWHLSNSLKHTQMGRKWPLKGDFLSIWDKNVRLLAMLDRCLLNRGSFTLEMHPGDQNWPLTGGASLKEEAVSTGLTV